MQQRMHDGRAMYNVSTGQQQPEAAAKYHHPVAAASSSEFREKMGTKERLALMGGW